MKNRFFLEKLVVTGYNVLPAVVTFNRGSNLIFGDSDTGKSYVFQCIDYLLGAANPPKTDIPEANGYSEAYLQIKTLTGDMYTIFRDLKNASKAQVANCEFERFKTSDKIILGQKNNSMSGDNISEFLLKLMGVENVELKYNKENTKKKLSYRDIARLTLVNEERIITEGSPVYSSMTGYMDFTKEKSVFRFMLTNAQDNELITEEKAVIYQTRIKGKLDLIETLISLKDEFIKSTVITNELTSEEIESKLNDLLIKLNASSTRIEELTVNREIVFNNLQKLKSEKLKNSELLKRFNLLKEHYNSDLNRLVFILEGNFLFDQLITQDCPLCGTIMDEEHLKCLGENQEMQQIAESVETETKKIRIKVKDLEQTLLNLREENTLTESQIIFFENNLKTINDRLNSELIPLKENFQKQITDLLTLSKKEQEIQSSKNDITNFYIEKEKLQKELDSKTKSGVANLDLDYVTLKSFCNSVEKVLSNWKYPSLSSVEFEKSHSVFDIKISNRNRNSHGKGVRAITYSAFILGLLDFCLEYSMPHPGFIVLDSPLTTFHQNQKREVDDEIEESMQDAFFDYLAKINDDRQIIILDNKSPDKILNNINYIQFSKQSTTLRKGFFPN